MRARLPAGAGLEGLRAAFDDVALAQLLLFVCPSGDFAGIVEQAHALYPDTSTLSATTAGEIGPDGYGEGGIVAIGLPAHSFSAETLPVALDALDPATLPQRMIEQRIRLASQGHGRRAGMGLLLVDGTSMREDTLLSAMAPGIGNMPLIGGSAGDGRDFNRAQLGLDGKVLRGAAVVSFLATDYQLRTFCIDHLAPTDKRMVVTSAVPERRLVRRINDEPAAAEYARIVGLSPDTLDAFAFAAHPVLVRLGASHHVRAIRGVESDGALAFFSAIDEGMVLTVAQAQDLPQHLDRELSKLSRPRPPLDVLAFDCVLRRVEAEQKGCLRDVSETLVRHRVVGCSTYGEQAGTLHVNHTLTGVAFYPPDRRPDPDAEEVP